MRIRRLHKKPAQLEIAAFLNLIVVLVPFLLSTSVFSRLAVLELTLPAQSASFDKLTGDLKLEIVIRPDALEVGDQLGGLIERIPNIAGAAVTPTAASATGATAAAVATGNTGPASGAPAYDIRTLGDLVQQIKEKFPDVTTATILAQPDTPYDVLVQVMDAVRSGRQARGAKVVRVDLFPDISIGDAPVAAQTAGASPVAPARTP
jgi:biopolymer transport protein ExbD